MIAPASSAAEPPDGRTVRRLVHRIAERYFGDKPRRIFRDRKGLTNLVYHVVHDDEEYVIRIGYQEGRLEAFRKEAAAVRAAREIGVPAPRVMEVGEDLGPYPYMILRRIRGISGLEAPNRLKLLHDLGAIAATLHTVKTVGYGGFLKREEPLTFKHSRWKHYLTREFDYPARLELFSRHELMSPQALKRLGRFLASAKGWDFEPALSHGDLRLKNVLVNDRGQIVALLDWEHCMSHLAPQWDLSLALHDLNIDEKQALLSGYGLTEAQIREMAETLKLFNLLNYAPEVERLVQCGELDSLEQLRTRLRGDLDLYSL